MPDIGEIFKPGAFEFTANTPLRAATRIQSAIAASGTNNFSPVSLPLLALSRRSLRFQLALDSKMATVERASPWQMGARYFFLCACVQTASRTEPASTTVEKKGPGN